MSEQLTWYESAGGPLLLVPCIYAVDWEGIETLSSGRTVQATFRWSDSDLSATDYDRACDIDDYVGVLEVGAGRAVVLGDIAMPTTWIPSSGGGILVRWLYAESDSSALRALSKVSEELWQDTGHTFHVPSGPLCLFDSALVGRDLNDDQVLHIHISPGIYRVDTVEFRPDENTFLVLHRLIPIS
jgi:hypothetical protein